MPPRRPMKPGSDQQEPELVLEPNADATVDTVDTGSEEGDEGEIARLAILDCLAYDQQREDTAKRLNIRVTTLDKLVKEYLVKSVKINIGEEPVTPAWPDPVDTHDLLTELEATLRQHVVLSDEAAAAVVLWVVHTHVFRQFDFTPRLLITAPMKRTGKSTLLDFLEFTCCQPTMTAANLTAASVYRTVESLHPTLLLDEFDKWIESKNELVGVLNSGFKYNGCVVRVVEINKEQVPTRFSTFAPVALAGIGNLPDGTLDDRCVPCPLRRKPKAIKTRKLRENKEVFTQLRQKSTRWAADHPDLAMLHDLLEEYNDRQGDIAEPLLAIADTAGGNWPGRIRSALVTLYKTNQEAEYDLPMMLLTDLHEIWTGHWKAEREKFAKNSVIPPIDAMSSSSTVDALIGLVDRPWGECQHGRPITAHNLAKFLKPFNIRPRMHRGQKQSSPFEYKTYRGYICEDFYDAWLTYLSLSPPLKDPKQP